MTVGAVGSRELECGEHFNITDGRLRDEARRNRSHLGQPMHRLQDLQSASYYRFDERKMPSQCQVLVRDPQAAI